MYAAYVSLRPFVGWVGAVATARAPVLLCISRFGRVTEDDAELRRDDDDESMIENLMVHTTHCMYHGTATGY
jgi:hypothetical protein